ncbi:MAG: hypothetical protein LBS68_00120 [Puniceicoccales bacterium]|nr:hypothetical protein [Puniceicoccales bacterium]
MGIPKENLPPNQGNQPTEIGPNSLLRQGGNHSSAAQRKTKSAFFQFLKNHPLGESHQTGNVILAVALTICTVFIYLIVMGIAYLASPKAPDPPKDPPKDPPEDPPEDPQLVALDYAPGEADSYYGSDCIPKNFECGYMDVSVDELNSVVAGALRRGVQE